MHAFAPDLHTVFLCLGDPHAVKGMRNLTLMSSNVYTIAMSFGLTSRFQRNTIYQRIAEEAVRTRHQASSHFFMPEETLINSITTLHHANTALCIEIIEEDEDGTPLDPGIECETVIIEDIAADTDATTDGVGIEPSAPLPPPAPTIMYVKQNLRSGQSMTHKGHLVIVGDVNAGAEVTADGDITIWGALRGVAHAGMSGDKNAQIRALRIEAIQLRIADAIARSPDRPQRGTSLAPETARIVNGTIRIAPNTPD
jgi:septum formation inhibitor MinC